MLKISIILALVFYGAFLIIRKAFQEYNWEEYTMEDREYNEQEGKDQKKETESKNRF